MQERGRAVGQKVHPSETSVRFWPWRMQGIEPEPERCGETLFHLFPQSQAGKEEVRAAAGLRS